MKRCDGAIRQEPKEGVRQYIDKQCSVFRGNIGAEFDAMLDELQEEFAVVVLGFPDNGRTTLTAFIMFMAPCWKILSSAVIRFTPDLF